MRPSLTYLAITLMSVAGLHACDSAFTGSGGGALGNSSNQFKGGPGGDGPGSGDGNPFGGPNGPYDPNDPNNPYGPNGNGDPNSPFGDGGGTGDNNGLNGGGGSGETTFSDATLTVLRADGSSKGQYNHSDVTIEFKVGSKTSGVVGIGKKGIVETLTGVCTTGKPIAFDLIITHKGRKIVPNKSSMGGILAKRDSKSILHVGYEHEAIGKPGADASADNNDDIIVTLACNGPTLADGSTPEVEINVKNLCIDPRIILSTWLSPSKSQKLGGRQCTGT